MKITSLLLITAALSLANARVFGGTLIFSGDTSGGNPFNRPTEAGDALSDIGTAVPYFAEAFTVGLNGNYSVSVQANNPASFDTFIHLYSGSFDPSSPLNNLVGANDDQLNGYPEYGSGFNSQPLIAGNSYILVIDGFGNLDSGPFSANISGPGSITPVPEPSSLALAALGLAGFWQLRRRNGNSQ